MPSSHFLTARRSGDEFSMMVFGCKDKAGIAKCLDTFYQKLGESPVALSPSDTKIISASSGFAWTADPNTKLEELLSHADEALYEIKRHTKGCYGEY